MLFFAQATFDQDVIDAANKSSEGASSVQTNEQYLSYEALLGRQFCNFCLATLCKCPDFS
jgi:hypothetical protein